VRLVLQGVRESRFLLGYENGRARLLDELRREPDCEVVTSTALFWRRAAGRISVETLLGAPDTSVRGNHELALALVESLVVML